jgi:hypothetical protein
MTQKSIQDFYPDDFAICYGCGRLNQHGHQLKSYWDGDETPTFDSHRLTKLDIHNNNKR